MPSRYEHLLHGTIASTDDPGLYLLIPKVATWFHLSIAHAYDLTIGVLILAATLIGACAIRKGSLRSAVLFGLAVVLTSHVADVYAFQALPALAGIPWLLRLSDDPKRLTWLAIVLAVFAGLCGVFRSQAGLPYIAMIAVLVFSRLPKIKAAALCVLLAILYLAPVAYARRVYPNFHPFWHSVYIGLGWVHNSEVARYRDDVGFAKVQSIDPDAVALPCCSPRYEAVLRNEVIRIAEHKPWIIAENLLAKLTFVGVGVGLLLLPVRRWDPAFAVSIALGALPGILVTPNPAYILGALCCACLYAGSTASAEGGSPIPTARELAIQHWNVTPLLVPEDTRYSWYPWLYEAAEFRRHQGEDVLEIGCGTGCDLLQFARHGARAMGVDVTPEHLRLARERVAGRAEVREGDATALPFPDQSFDYVYSHGVLHHIDQPRKVVEEIFRVLRPGGRFNVQVYAFWSWAHLSYRRQYGRQWKLHVENSPDPVHIELYTARQLRKLFAPAKLAIRKYECHHLQSAGWLLGWMLVAKGEASQGTAERWPSVGASPCGEPPQHLEQRITTAGS